MTHSNLPSGRLSDLGYLHSLSNGSKAFVTEMTELFLSEIPTELDSFRMAIQDADYPQIQAIAHHLRSTVPFVGLNAYIEKELIETEQFAKDSSRIEDIRTYFTKINAVCLQAADELIADRLNS